MEWKSCYCILEKGSRSEAMLSFLRRRSEQRLKMYALTCKADGWNRLPSAANYRNWFHLIIYSTAPTFWVTPISDAFYTLQFPEAVIKHNSV